jgi:predicted porin
MDGSRLGFRGNEDLGGGYRGIFTMEHRLEVDTGDVSNVPPSGSQVPDRLTNPTLLYGSGFSALPLPTQTALRQLTAGAAAGLGGRIGVNLNKGFWDRQIYVGLVTPVGAVLAGRQYTPAYETSAIFDVMGTQSSLAAGQVAAFPPAIEIRVSNAVSYRVQKGPWSGSLMYAAAENSTATGRTIGGNAMYKTDRFAVGVGMNTRENELGKKSLKSTIVGASVNLGPGTLVSSFAKVKDDNPAGLSSIGAQLTQQTGAPVSITGQVQGALIQALRQDANLFHIGYRLTTGPHTFYTAYTRMNDRRPADADTASYGGGYTYAFSKRTDLNVILTHFNNSELAQAAPGQGGSIGGVTASAGTDSNSYSLGLRHRF